MKANAVTASGWTSENVRCSSLVSKLYIHIVRSEKPAASQCPFLLEFSAVTSAGLMPSILIRLTCYIREKPDLIVSKSSPEQPL